MENELYFYAELDASNKVFSVLQTSKPFKNPSERIIQINANRKDLLGCTYVDGEFLPAPPPPVELSRLQLIDALGDDYYAIVAASKTDVQVEVWLEKFRLTNTFIMSDPAVIEQLQFLVNKELVSQNKIDQILNQ